MQVEKKLTLLRHGEAAVGMGQSGDLKRKLTQQGRIQLLRLSNLLEFEEMHFDYAVSSPAMRCLESLEIINKEKRIPKVEKNPSIYDAPVMGLLDIINSFEDTYSNVLLIGHNPGISHLVGFLTGDSSIVFVPGMLVRISFEFADWKLVSRNSGRILEVIQ
ncbi:SixA phosphatase family protein [Lunatibacter salilacus]|uniref:SixA phosphatase family protein n=1 Tax=Lunatibacter salilacus TaxID=2483804 RepID=UPI00131D2E69|nr:histidine phosphatase family protein [Lunatibacter salilacus]